MSDDLAYRIGKMRLVPGDVLVVKCNEQLRAEQMQALREHLKEALGVLGPGIPTLCIDSRLDLAVLTRAEIEAKIDEAS